MPETESTQHAGLDAPTTAVVNALYPNETLDEIPPTPCDIRVQTARQAIGAYLAAMTAQHPAAPETDVSALWALSTPSLWESPDDRSIPTLLAAIGQVLQQPSADLDAARERVRVVEGERDAWKRERDEYVSSICFETTCTNCAHMLDQLAATQELVDGDHIEAAKSQRIKSQQGALAILRTDRDHWQSRAESAEAAHEAEKAAHDAARENDARALIAALKQRWDGLPGRLAPHVALDDVRQEIRSLLGGGEAR